MSHPQSVGPATNIIRLERPMYRPRCTCSRLGCERDTDVGAEQTTIARSLWKRVGDQVLCPKCAVDDKTPAIGTPEATKGGKT